jgi:uncharacterized membrane protein YphA (DoxX/SURF4 family)
MKLGVSVLAATGMVNLAFGAFDPAEEPIQAWGENVPHGLFPDVVAILLIVGGATIVSRRSVRFGAVLLALCYLLFALFALPRVFLAPHYVGWRGAIGAAVGVGQNLIIVAAATILCVAASARASARLENLAEIARWVFGISTITFGLGHLTGIAGVAAMVPKWMPLGGAPWAIITGIAFVLAGIAILCGVLGALAARLLALMLLIFSVAVLGRQLFHFAHVQAAWGVNVYNLAAVGAAWILADWLARPRLKADAMRA